MEVGTKVWVVFDPIYGYLEQPIEDVIKEVDNENTTGVILEKLNHINDNDITHWTNDWYGNLVDTKYLFKTYEEAKNNLMSYYANEKSNLENKLAKINRILEKNG